MRKARSNSLRVREPAPLNLLRHPIGTIVLTGLIAPAAGAPPSSSDTRPIFAPGLYETESRNPAVSDHGTRSTGCILSADADAFRRETIARFLTAPQFRAVCRLSAARPIPDGFAFAMDCGQARSVITYVFARDLVTSTTRTRVASRPSYSSEIVTLSRRIGACRGSTPAGKL